MRLVRAWACLWVCCLFGLVPTPSWSEEFLFRPHDRVLFLGDSITEQYQYSTYLELYLTTRFPAAQMEFLNAGIGGDTAHGGANRFQSHVLDEHPTVITINFGMNDAGYGAFDAGRHATYLKGTEQMLEAAKGAGIRVGLVSPNAVDRRIQERFKLYVETQKQFYAPLQDLAKKHGCSFADQYAITRAAIEKMEADNASSVIPYYDGFHTSPPGGLLMAHAILAALHAPAQVSQVAIDAQGKVQAESCDVSGLQRDNDVLTFERRDAAIPLPVLPVWSTLLPYVNDLKDLNWYGLKVEGLNAEKKYVIEIDDVAVTSATGAQLAAGVNLGNLPNGPLFDQGLKVFDLVNKKNEVVHQRFRNVVMFHAPDWLADVVAERKPKELAKRKERIQAMQAEVYQLAKPAPHRFRVRPE